LAELVTWDDIDFVRCAYVTVLGRQPDPSGEKHNLQLLRGGASKLRVLAGLRFSDEGKSHDPGIAGFDRQLRRYRRANDRRFGWLYRPWVRTELENSAERRRRITEQRLARIERALLAPAWSSKLDHLTQAIASLQQGQSQVDEADRGHASARLPAAPPLDAHFTPQARSLFKLLEPHFHRGR